MPVVRRSKLPPHPPVLPQFPFQHVCVDFMQSAGVRYAVMDDRYSGWPSVSKPAELSVTDWFTDFCSVFGIPDVITTDGGPEFMSVKFKQALRDYGVHHRVSTPYNPHANCRAELGVKTMKRIIRENVGSDGNLRTPKFVKAMLQYKNTPDRDWGISPAECIFGRQLTDYLLVSKQNFLQNCSNEWKCTLEERERAFKPRYSALEKRWRQNTKKLQPLNVGDRVTVQDRHGNTPNKWSR